MGGGRERHAPIRPQHDRGFSHRDGAAQPRLTVTSDVLRGDFDRRGSATAVPFEATIAEFDSGSGWFVENGPGNWQVRGHRAQYVDHTNGKRGQPGEQALIRLPRGRVDRRPRHVGSDPPGLVRRLHQRQRAGADRPGGGRRRRDAGVRATHARVRVVPGRSSLRVWPFAPASWPGLRRANRAGTAWHTGCLARCRARRLPR